MSKVRQLSFTLIVPDDACQWQRTERREEIKLLILYPLFFGARIVVLTGEKIK
jgi:hypothetical protein